MTNESAIVEENDLQADDLQETEQTDPVADQYDIEEPADDSEEFNVPVIDNLEDDDEKIPSSEKKEKAKPKPSVKTEQDTGEEKEADSKQQNLPDELVAKAKKLGISDEDISLFEKPAQLEKLCSLIEPTAAEAKDQQESKTEQKTETAYDEGDFKLALDPDLYDPDLCKAMESTASQINGIKKALSDVVSAINRQSEQTFEKNFEGMIAGLGDEFADTLGQGSLDEIGTDSDFYKNRCKLIEEMNAIALGYSQTGKAIPAQKQLFKRAVNSVFGDKIKSNARKQIASQLDKRSGQIISRPTGRKGKDSQTPDQRATTAVREKLREFGAYDDNEIAEDF